LFRDCFLRNLHLAFFGCLGSVFPTPPNSNLLTPLAHWFLSRLFGSVFARIACQFVLFPVFGPLAPSCRGPRFESPFAYSYVSVVRGLFLPHLAIFLFLSFPFLLFFRDLRPPNRTIEALPAVPKTVFSFRSVPLFPAVVLGRLHKHGCSNSTCKTLSPGPPPFQKGVAPFSPGISLSPPVKPLGAFVFTRGSPFTSPPGSSAFLPHILTFPTGC